MLEKKGVSMNVTRKTETGTIDGTPEKRLFWSIISDYSLKTAICELVDNALDLWVLGKEKRKLEIDISLDSRQQTITVTDTAGGIRKDELRLIVAPGGSRNDPDEEIIGIFGVGSKRAVVALGERVEIRTRAKGSGTYQLDITPQWLQSTDWEMPIYEVPDISQSRTEIHISHLRSQLGEEDIHDVSEHLSETYADFLGEQCIIRINGKEMKPHSFDMWAYPPGFEPKFAAFEIPMGRDGVIKAEIHGGLILDRDPVLENYGGYFYCNRRLIVKELRNREIGYFVTTEAGVPHPDGSLARVIINLHGPAKLMPWNSSKTGINYGHPIFKAISNAVIQLTSHFSSLSRRLKGDWESEVFRYKKGRVDNLVVPQPELKNPLKLPSLPKVQKKYAEKLISMNQRKVGNQPWTLGLVESIALVDVVNRQKLQTRNRVALILLDSTFEIALKEYIVHRTDLFKSNIFTDTKIQELFSKRHEVIKTVKPHVSVSQTMWDKAQHYYLMRNKLIHERATLSVTDNDVDNYRKLVTQILTKLFDLKF